MSIQKLYLIIALGLVSNIGMINASYHTDDESNDQLPKWNYVAAVYAAAQMPPVITSDEDNEGPVVLTNQKGDPVSVANQASSTAQAKPKQSQTLREKVLAYLKKEREEEASKAKAKK